MNYVLTWVSALLVFLCVNLSSVAYAIDIYVDTETKQLFMEAGPGRTRLGTLNIENTPDETRLEEGGNNVAQSVNTSEKKVSREEQAPVDTSPRITQRPDGAFTLESADGDFNFKLGGRIHADASFSKNDNFQDDAGNPVEANNGTEIRRGRLKFEGTFYKDWFFKSEVDFANNKPSITDMFIQYSGLGFARIRVGQQKQAFSRELQESANDLLFLERSAMNVLNTRTVNRTLGINIAARGENVLGLGQNWSGQVGIYGDTVSANQHDKFAGEGWGVSSRVTFAPIAQKDSVFHIGIAGNYREPNDAGEILDSPLTLAYETTNMSNLNLLKVGITDISSIKMVGIEGHGLKGPFSIGGEYTHSWIDIKGGASDLSLYGWYTEAALTLTGESRIYRDGLFYRVIPNQTFSLTRGGLGAWEIAARYGEVDLNDGTFQGGKLGNFTVGLNWYPNRAVRFMASYDRVLKVINSPLHRQDGGKVGGLNTFMFRAQLVF